MTNTSGEKNLVAKEGVNLARVECRNNARERQVHQRWDGYLWMMRTQLRANCN
jgi:hypothetical protein